MSSYAANQLHRSLYTVIEKCLDFDTNKIKVYGLLICRLRQTTAYGVSKLQVLGNATEIKAYQNDIEIINSLIPYRQMVLEVNEIKLLIQYVNAEIQTEF